MLRGRFSFWIICMMSYVALSSVLWYGWVFVPIERLVYAMGWFCVFLVGVRSGGGAYSVLPITRPHVVQTISPFSLSFSMVVLLHSGQKSALCIRYPLFWSLWWLLLLFCWFCSLLFL